MEMKNFGLAVQDASSLCRMKPFWTKVRDLLFHSTFILAAI